MASMLITGKSGFLGARLAQTVPNSVALGHRELDISRLDSVREALAQHRPTAVFNCAAVSDIGECDRNPERAESVNYVGAVNLAQACAEQGVKLIHCSSDQVYFGNGVRAAHAEGEPLCPRNLYGRQKLRAENAILRVQPNSVILRLSMLYAADAQAGQHENFLTLLSQKVAAGEPLSYPVHDWRCITNVWDIVRRADAIAALPAGVYNIGSETERSPAQLVEWLNAALGLGAKLCPNESAFAEEPRNLAMNCGKLRSAGVALPSVEDGLLANADAIRALCQGR